MTTDTIERRYVLTKLRAGDYLLPANDGNTLWRIARYTEDGSAEWPDGTPVRGEFWGAWRWRGTMADRIEPEWYEWELWAQGYGTRAEAMAHALKFGEAHA
jgi:hypothetical protein